MFGKIRLSRWLAGVAVLATAECASVAAIEFALTAPAQAQFFGSSRQRPQRSGGFFDGFFGQPSRPAYEGDSEREPQYSAPADNSRAPSPRKPDKDQAQPTTSIVVLGDGMADWLAYGLEDAFSDTPEVGIIRKNKQRSGLLHYEPKGDLDWWHVARDILAQEKPSYVIMMLGVSDRQNISGKDLAKEADKKEAEKKKADAAKSDAAKSDAAKSDAAKSDAAKSDAAKSDAAKPDGAAPGAAKPDADKNAQNKDAAPENTDEPDPIIAPEPARGKSANGTLEFRTEQWAQIYSRRIDETVAALKSKGVPVFWVGLPSIRGPKSTADAVYLNDLYRARAEKAGAIYIDVWDGFVDEGGKFTTNGPDYEGQVRRLRSSDGVYFTKYGARKLAHYVERELRRYMSNRSLQISLPSGPMGPLPADGKSAARPLAGPVVPLTVTPGNSDELLGGAGSGSAHGDAIATRVLVKGEPVPAPPGRADDFSWKQGTDANASVPANPAPAEAAIPVTTPAMTNSALAPEKAPAEPSKTTQGSTAKTKPQREEKPRTVQNNPPRQAAAPQQRPPSNPFGWFR